MEQSVTEGWHFKNDIVQRIDKLIHGWEREYGITNKTMVDAMVSIIDLKAENEILMNTIRIAAEQIEKLKLGPGGIMEMKQTISDKEDEIARLEQYESMVHYIANDYIELSYEKAQCQRDDWLKRCKKIIAEEK
jgi:hypothetical protein